jgi:hypothetical protein
VVVFDKSGKHLGTIETGEATANCGWGDDGSTLYVTADMHLGADQDDDQGGGLVRVWGSGFRVQRKASGVRDKDEAEPGVTVRRSPGTQLRETLATVER